MSKIDILEPLETEAAAKAFAALGSEHRIAVLKLLVRAGPGGARVGELSGALEMAPSTLTHHLRFLTEAGLVRQVRQGRAILCAADFDAVGRLSDFLLDECCADASADASGAGGTT
jgi:DNA-binding transcriptional ArsR family regulator